MSNNAASIVITGAIVGLIGFKVYKQHQARKAEDAKLAKVKDILTNLLKDVPGYNKPSR